MNIQQDISYDENYADKKNIQPSNSDSAATVLKQFIKSAIVDPGRFLDDSCKRLEAEEDINFMWNNEIVKLYEKLIGYGFNFSDRFDGNNRFASPKKLNCHLISPITHIHNLTTIQFIYHPKNKLSPYKLDQHLISIIEESIT